MSPTNDDLAQEVWWNAQYVPKGLQVLRGRLLEHYGWSPDQIGIYGDVHHLYGYHRSRNWIRNSQFCTNRSLSVTETPGNRDGGDGDEIAGIDLITEQGSAREIDARLRSAKARGLLPMVRQIILESSPWHNHISIDRGMVHADLSAIFDAVTGGINQGVKMVTFNLTMPELKQGSTGPDVKTFQTLANFRGASLQVDGEFGPLTEGAARAMQEQYGAESIDGVVGPETWTIAVAAQDQN